MNILVIGNGFDLAHGLPTNYSDFLTFCRMIKEVYSIEQNGNENQVWDDLGIELKQAKNTERFKKLFFQMYSISHESENCIKTDTNYDEFYENIKDNAWLEYFLNRSSYRGDNWIDLETEMSEVIEALVKTYPHT